MASIQPLQPELQGPIRPRTVLTAGFNSPVPECTLQFPSPSADAARPSTPHRLGMMPLAGRTWFSRLLEIF